MKKISLLALAVCSLLLVACKKPVGQENNFKVKYELKLPIDGTMKVVKDGDSFVVNTKSGEKAIFGEEELGIEGKLTTNMEIKLIADIQRKEGTKDALCMGDNCVPGNTKEYQQLEYNISAEGSNVDFHCLPEGNGDNIITYSLYPKDEPQNKLTFKINYRKQ